MKSFLFGLLCAFYLPTLATAADLSAIAQLKCQVLDRVSSRPVPNAVLTVFADEKRDGYVYDEAAGVLRSADLRTDGDTTTVTWVLGDETHVIIYSGKTASLKIKKTNRDEESPAQKLACKQ